MLLLHIIYTCFEKKKLSQMLFGRGSVAERNVLSRQELVAAHNFGHSKHLVRHFHNCRHNSNRPAQSNLQLVSQTLLLLQIKINT